MSSCLSIFYECRFKFRPLAAMLHISCFEMLKTIVLSLEKDNNYTNIISSI
jgi:hypothetical protein